MQRAPASVEAAAGGELPERHAGDFCIARQNDASRGAARGCQPRYHARHGKPRGDPLQRRRYIDLEGSFLSARDERLLRLPCEMVTRLAILRLQPDVFALPFPLAISDHGEY